MEQLVPNYLADLSSMIEKKYRQIDVCTDAELKAQLEEELFTLIDELHQLSEHK